MVQFQQVMNDAKKAFIKNTKVISKAAEGIKRFAKLERVLAFMCLFIPALLYLFDDGPIRDSISAYYDMEQNQIFYFSLTVTAMLFIVNGVIKNRRSYNTILGVALAGVILLNHDDFSSLHYISAFVFFVGNAYVMVVFSSKVERKFKIMLAAIMLVSMVLCWYIDAVTLFWAEWISLIIIAIHYIRETWIESKYTKFAKHRQHITSDCD